jgi:hypothetical protein
LRSSNQSGRQVSSMKKRLYCAIALVTLAGLGCAPSSMSSNDGGGGGGGTGGGGGSGGGGAVTYTSAVKPILMAKCAPCHTTQAAGGHDVAAEYHFVHELVRPATEPGASDTPEGCFDDGPIKMDPKTIGECTLAAIMTGWMPQGMGCFAMPRPAGCVSLAEQDIIAAWVAAGMPE